MPLSAFRLEFSGERADVTASVNDVPVMSTPGGRALDASVAITPWLLTGTNVLALSLTASGTAPRPDAAGSAIFGVRDASVPGSDLIPLTSLVVEPEKDPTVTSAPPGPNMMGSAGPVTARTTSSSLQLRRSVVISAPLPRWAWIDSAVIPADDDTSAELWREYEAIWKLLDERRLGTLPDLLRERTTEYRQALYADADELPSDYGIGALVRSGAALLPLPAEPVFHLFGGGRLAEWTRQDGRPVVTFDEGGVGRFFRFVFRRVGKGWTVTR